MSVAGTHSATAPPVFTDFDNGRIRREAAEGGVTADDQVMSRVASVSVGVPYPPRTIAETIEAAQRVLTFARIARGTAVLRHVAVMAEANRGESDYTRG
jgi:hypothetical protein